MRAARTAWLSAPVAARRLGLSVRDLVALCRAGRVTGARLVGGARWFVAADSCRLLGGAR